MQCDVACAWVLLLATGYCWRELLLLLLPLLVFAVIPAPDSCQCLSRFVIGCQLVIVIVVYFWLLFVYAP